MARTRFTVLALAAALIVGTTEAGRTQGANAGGNAGAGSLGGGGGLGGAAAPSTGAANDGTRGAGNSGAGQSSEQVRSSPNASGGHPGTESDLSLQRGHKAFSPIGR